MLGSDIDIQRAVFVFAISQAFKLEAASLLMNLSTSPVWVSKRSLLTSILDGAIVPVGLMNAPICRLVTRLTKLVQLNVVIDVFFPLQQEFIQRNAALAQGKLGQAVFRFGLEAQVFQRHITFVGQFDL